GIRYRNVTGVQTCALPISAAVTAELDRQKLKAANVISFMVDGVTILEFPAVRSWWEAFRQQFCPQGERVPCLITGQLTVPLATEIGRASCRERVCICSFVV